MDLHFSAYYVVHYFAGVLLLCLTQRKTKGKPEHT